MFAATTLPSGAVSSPTLNSILHLVGALSLLPQPASACWWRGEGARKDTPQRGTDHRGDQAVAAGALLLSCNYFSVARPRL